MYGRHQGRQEGGRVTNFAAFTLAVPDWILGLLAIFLFICIAVIAGCITAIEIMEKRRLREKFEDTYRGTK